MNIILLVILAAAGIYLATRLVRAAPPPPAQDPAPPGPSVSRAEVVAETQLREAKEVSAGLQETYEVVRITPAVPPPEPVARKDYDERLSKARSAMDAANAEAAKLKTQSDAQAGVVSGISTSMAGASGTEYTRLLAEYQAARARHMELLAQYETARQATLAAGITYSEIRAGV